MGYRKSLLQSLIFEIILTCCVCSAAEISDTTGGRHEQAAVNTSGTLKTSKIIVYVYIYEYIRVVLVPGLEISSLYEARRQAMIVQNCHTYSPILKAQR